MDGSTLGAAIALIKKNKPTDEQIESAVDNWLDDHPEATTTVQDGSITKAKLDENLQETVDDVSDLKNEIDQKVNADGIDEVTPKNLQILDKEISPNLIDETKLTLGKYIGKNGTIYSGNYNLTDYIPVEAGKTYNGSNYYNGNRLGHNTYSWFAFFNEDKTVNTTASADISSLNSPFTIPNGVSYIRLSITNSSSYIKWMLEEGTEATEYHPYGEVYDEKLKDQYIPEKYVERNEISMLKPSATAEDIGKALILKTIDGNGNPTEFEYGETGSGRSYVETDGTDQVTAKNLQIMEKTYSPNLIDTTKLTDGKYIKANGTIQNGNYQYTDYIPVEEGEKYYFAWTLNGTTRQSGGLRFLACYDSSKTVMPSAGSDTWVDSPFTIPEGVAYIIMSFPNYTTYTEYQLEKGETRTAYVPYGQITHAVVKDEYLPDEPVDMADIPAFELVRGQNILNPNDPNYQTGKFLYTNGNVDDHASYTTSGYIAVSEGDNLLASYVNSGGGTGRVQFRTVACYDASKSVQGTKGVYSVDRFVVPSGVAFVRVCYQSSTYGFDVQVISVGEGEGYYPYKAYENPHYEIKEDCLPETPEKPVHVYLPSDIYVAVGRTIELYNEQVVLDHEKYHFQWKCIKGSAYKRKFSITGSTTGNYMLGLYLYDDKQRLVWTGESTIHVVSASNPEVKILPIGDSLTRGKAWLPETMLLSSSNVEWLGTRYSNNLKDSENNTYAKIHHEGRSGWSAGDYLADTVYDQDTAYDGVPGVDGSANPFWDGTKFSLEHYLTTQTGIDTPDAVQIFLGTNDLISGAETATENIMAIVESIRSEYANLPIFLCNTIYRSNQNGYGSTGTEAYAGGSGANGWQYEQDSRVMDLMTNLRHELASYTGVYMIPLAVCMDREYSFGQVMTKVNPRSTVEVPMPSESVHPQNVGYFQMADLMYSAYCGVLS